MAIRPSELSIQSLAQDAMPNSTPVTTPPAEAMAAAVVLVIAAVPTSAIAPYAAAVRPSQATRPAAAPLHVVADVLVRTGEVVGLAFKKTGSALRTAF